MYGIQTCFFIEPNALVFENDVKMYGIQTFHNYTTAKELFENDVKMYGIQTNERKQCIILCLRMM